MQPGYNFDKHGALHTADGYPVIAVIYEPDDFDRTHKPHGTDFDEAETLEWFLGVEEGEMPNLPARGSEERRALIAGALLDTDIPDMVYELIRDCVRDKLREMLNEPADSAH